MIVTVSLSSDELDLAAPNTGRLSHDAKLMPATAVAELVRKDRRFIGFVYSGPRLCVVWILAFRARAVDSLVTSYTDLEIARGDALLWAHR